MEENRRRTQWEREYSLLKGINLGYGEELPDVVAAFMETLSRNSIDPGSMTVIDAGCGKGRIGIHLARQGCSVIGFDFVQTVLDEFTLNVVEQHLEHLVTLFQQDINDSWNVPDNNVDAVFAITIIDNLITDKELSHFRNEVHRVTKPGGFLVVEHYLPEDGYYGELLKTALGGPHSIITDPNNGLVFRLFSDNEIVKLFKEKFTVIYSKKRSFISIKYNKPYPRSSQIIIFRKK